MDILYFGDLLVFLSDSTSKSSSALWNTLVITVNFTSDPSVWGPTNIQLWEELLFPDADAAQSPFLFYILARAEWENQNNSHRSRDKGGTFCKTRTISGLDSVSPGLRKQNASSGRKQRSCTTTASSLSKVYLRGVRRFHTGGKRRQMRNLSAILFGHKPLETA